MRVVGLADPDALRGSGLRFSLGDEWDDAKPVVLPEIIRRAPDRCGVRRMLPERIAGTTNVWDEKRDGRCAPLALCIEGIAFSSAWEPTPG